MKNEFRIVEKKALTKDGIITYYEAQHRIRLQDEEKEPSWHHAREYKDGENLLLGFLSPPRYPSIEEAKQAIEKSKKSLEIHQYENVVYQEPPIEN